MHNARIVVGMHLYSIPMTGLQLIFMSVTVLLNNSKDFVIVVSSDCLARNLNTDTIYFTVSLINN